MSLLGIEYPDPCKTRLTRNRKKEYVGEKPRTKMTRSQMNPTKALSASRAFIANMMAYTIAGTSIIPYKTKKFQSVF